MQYVEDDRVPYAYTIGLSRHRLPEFLMTGVSPQRALQLLGGIAESAPDIEVPAPGQRLTLSGTLVEVVEVEHPDAHMNAAIAIYGSQLRGLQLVWADWRGRWPWAARFNNGRANQPGAWCASDSVARDRERKLLTLHPGRMKCRGQQPGIPLYMN